MLTEFTPQLVVAYANLTENMLTTGALTLVLMIGAIISWEMLTDQSVKVGINPETAGVVTFTVILFVIFGSTIARALTVEKELPITLVIFAICIVIAALARLVLYPWAVRKFS